MPDGTGEDVRGARPSPSPSTSPARSAARRSRSSRPATSRSTRPTAPARLRRARHHVRGRPRAGRPEPRPVAERGRHRAVGERRARSTSRGCSRRWPRSTASTSTCRGRSSRRRSRRCPATASKSGKVQVQLQEPLRPAALSSRRSYEGVIPFLQRRHTDAESDWQPRADRGLHARGAVPGVRRRPARAVRRSPSRSTGATSADVCEPVDRRGGEGPRGARAVRARPHDRRAGGEGGQRPHGLPARRRARLPHAVSLGRHARRRRGAAHPARQRRSAAGSSACCTCSTSRRSACTSATTAA